MLLDFNHWTLRNPERGRDLLDVFSKEELLALLASYALGNDPRFADARTPLVHGSDKHDSTVCAANDPRLLTTLDSRSRVFSSFLPNVATALTLTSGTAYFVYLGRTVTTLTPKHVEFYVSTAGSGAQTAEAGFFSSPNSPNKGAQTVTKLVSTGTLDSLTTTGVKRNTAAFATSVPAGIHLWAGLRTAMATTQPAIAGLCMDFSQGRILSTVSSGVLTGTGPWTGAIVAVGAYMNTPVCPDLRGVLD